ncbi:MAG: hypothetical protein M5U25_00885 [Planctomycetota bacterium]|nr:hypothetical protein [Planctomycetota bacterium]
MSFAKLGAFALFSVLLVGCGGGLRVTTPEIDDAAALEAVSAFHIAQVENTTPINPEWEISESDWKLKTNEWSSQFAGECGRAEKAVYALGPGAEAKEGAVVSFKVTDMNLGTYAYFYKHPGWIKGVLTISDAASGKVLFRGSVDSMGTTDGTDRFSLEGRIKVAHLRVAQDVAWLIDRKSD